MTAPQAASRLSHLDWLEAEAIHILREGVVEGRNLLTLFSAGKDSTILVHLALHAFDPSPHPFRCFPSIRPGHLLEASLQAAEDRIDWVLAHPGMSDWLKQSLRSTRDREPVDLLNNLEMLQHLLGHRSRIQIPRETGTLCAEWHEQLRFTSCRYLVGEHLGFDKGDMTAYGSKADGRNYRYRRGSTGSVPFASTPNTH